MKELFEKQLMMPDRHSSKGNQLKWEDDGIWYKADYTGYEGLSEYVVSKLLSHSNLDEEEYVPYELVEISYRNRVFTGARSRSILQDDWQIITLERLFKKKDVDAILDEATMYPVEIRERVRSILYEQMRKYQYLFNDSSENSV